MRTVLFPVLLLVIMFTFLIVPASAATFTFSSSGDGSAGWSTEQAYSGSQSAKLNSGTGGFASAGKVSMTYAQPLSSITAITFWYRVSSGSTAIPSGELSAWPLYAREGTTFPFTADGYFSPYIIIAIDVSGTPHWIISQVWAEPASRLDTWIEWKMSDNAIAYGGFDPSVTLWHDELWTDDGGTGGAGSWPAGWEPLSFFQTTYAGATIVSVGIAVGWWAVDEPQIVYVDSLTINGVGYNIDPPSERLSRSYPVGGVVMPVNTLAILAPYLALVGLVASVSGVYVTKRRRH